MALHTKDKLSEIIGADIASDRAEKMILVFAAQIDIKIQKTSIGRKIRDEIADFLKQNINIKNNVQNALRREFVPLEEFEWLIKSRRQSEFIEVILATNQPQFSINLNQAIPFQWPVGVSISPFTMGKTPLDLIGKELSIALLDYWISFFPGDMQAKISIIKLIRTAWEGKQENDKKFDWFKKDDSKERIEYFWEWLKSNVPHLTNNHASLQNHEELLSFFDQIQIHDSEKYLLAHKFKNTWNQKQLRARTKGKRQCNFILSEKTISKLERLAEKYHLSRTEIVELIIDAEAAKEIYISERLNQRKLLKPQESDK